MKNVWYSIALAAVCWFVMFSPWTAPYVPFWWTMAGVATVLTCISFFVGGKPMQENPGVMRSLALGLFLAVCLWGVFWLGDKISQWMFSFARPQVDNIYEMKDGTSPWTIGALLLLIIGPAEEFFWRGFIQRKMALQWGPWKGFLVATLCYTAIHVWSGNFMLLAAAGVCGFCWGGLYYLFPRQFPAIVISHAVWDVAAFVLFPF